MADEIEAELLDEEQLEAIIAAGIEEGDDGFDQSEVSAALEASNLDAAAASSAAATPAGSANSSSTGAPPSSGHSLAGSGVSGQHGGGAAMHLNSAQDDVLGELYDDVEEHEVEEGAADDDLEPSTAAPPALVSPVSAAGTEASAQSSPGAAAGALADAPPADSAAAASDLHNASAKPLGYYITMAIPVIRGICYSSACDQEWWGNQVDYPPKEPLRDLSGEMIVMATSARAGNSVPELLDNSTETFWQSDGGVPHGLLIQFYKRQSVAEIAMYIDFRVDESYTPAEMSLRCGNSHMDLEEVRAIKLEEPVGWVRLPFVQSDRRGLKRYLRTNIIQILIPSNHQSGRDTHIRMLKVFGPGLDGPTVAPTSPSTVSDAPAASGEGAPHAAGGSAGMSHKAAAAATADAADPGFGEPSIFASIR